MSVPFLDLASHHAALRPDLVRAFSDVLDSGAFAGGPFVERFEESFATLCGVRHAIGVGNGTDALWLALVAAGVGPGDEVITSPMTFIATAEAISRTGATPVFVDIDALTFTIDPEGVARAINCRTKAIVPVHLFGQMADMRAIGEIAAVWGIPVIEDAAQAHGATYEGRPAGGIGAMGCFSFYPGKNLGALGEAGAVVTDCDVAAERIRMIRDHGQREKYHHALIGWNCRMDAIQAAVLAVKLPHLQRNSHLRRRHAEDYADKLRGVPGVVLPMVGPRRTHVHHLYVVRVADRAAFTGKLKHRGIGFGIHYPTPIHLQECYADLGLRRGMFPVAERCADEFVSLPMFPELESGQIDMVAGAVREASRERSAA